MRPIDELSPEEARGLRGLLFDLDDTLLDHGLLTEQAYAALHRLHASGLRLIGVTGRPAGYGAVLARQWPVAALVTENGAVSYYREGRALRRHDALAPGERERRRRALAQIVASLMEAFPALRPADDVELRTSDFAFDIAEHHQVDPSVVAQAVERARSLGARTFTSSVHLHVTLAGADKASGSVRLLGLLWGEDPTAACHRYAFVGDSENDAACFAAFDTTVAVKNFAGRPTVPPRFVTPSARGAGFAELSRVLIAARQR